MRANVFDGDGTPTLRQIPLKTWTGSTRKHHLTYRAWRNTGNDKLFNAYLEVQVTGKASLFVNFGAKSEKGNGDPGLSRIDNGLAVGSGSNPYPRRSGFSMLVGKLHRNVDWSLKGTWRKDFLGPIISSQRINRIPGI
ncbi:histidine permease [Colletotrichum higginsianum]|nr:histidine permease [Colletotrichum higginsianum]